MIGGPTALHWLSCTNGAYATTTTTVAAAAAATPKSVDTKGPLPLTPPPPPPPPPAAAASNTNLVELFINGKPVKIEAGSAVIQACALAGEDIPRFCYHERLAVAGNCRMCLVEVEKSPKPVVSCAMPVMPGMKVWTKTPLVKRAREGVMEFLLANHPLDCPICDQGGECDLQDQSMAFGSDRGRYHEDVGKRAVEDKNLGPLVKTTMTRCIHCTRCVRFAVDVAGMDELGTSGRGADMQIGTYVEKTLSSEMSGNIIDLCPVGALTSKPYAFTARPWELKKTESIDVMDAVGSHIRIDSRGSAVMRVLPRLNEAINEEWLADKSRFAYDGLRRQRLESPLLRMADGKYASLPWDKALGLLSSRVQGLSGSELVAYAGAMADVESMLTLKDLFHHLNSAQLYLDRPLNHMAFNSSLADIRANYLFNSTISAIERADCILLIGTNPRHEAALLNARIRKAYVQSGVQVGLIGDMPALNYPVTHLGTGPKALMELIKGKGGSKSPLAEFLAAMKSAQRPMVIVGSAIFERSDADAVVASVNALCGKLSDVLFQPDWNGYNVLQREASRVGALDIGFLPSHQPWLPKASSTLSSSLSLAKFVYLLHADDVPASSLPPNAFIVYQGTHGDQGAQVADLILPGAAYTEKDCTFVNLEGRPQRTKAAVPCPAGAREDWQILRAFAEVLGVPLPYSDLFSMRQRMYEVAPHLLQTELVQASSLPMSMSPMALGLKATTFAKMNMEEDVFRLPIEDYYMTDPISRNSLIMSKCSKAYTKGEQVNDMP